MRFRALAFVAALSVALIGPAIGQTADAPKKRENARYMDVNNWTFVPGGVSRAKEIWHEIYLPAMKASGVPLPTILHPDTGEWDLVIIFPLPGGYADLEYTNLSPSDAKWVAQMERTLGVAKAKAVGIELDKLIARKQRYIAHEHVEGAD